MMIGQLQHSSSYVSVGAAADYPDTCLITLSLPDWDSAWLFFESDSDIGKRVFKANSELSAAALDESVKDWNASVDDQATLTVN